MITDSWDTEGHMLNRRLTADEREIAGELIADVRKRVTEISEGNKELEWALRRYVYIRLQHDERGTPMERRALKAIQRSKQNELCSLCGEQLPKKGAVLDRLEAMKGYTEDNTRLLCPSCDKKVQEQRHYA